MVPALHGRHPVDPGLPDGGRPAGRVWLALLLGTLAIAAVVAAAAAASAWFGIGPWLEPVGYLLIAISAVMILGNYVITFFAGGRRRGLVLAAFWALALSAALGVFEAFG